MAVKYLQINVACETVLAFKCMQSTSDVMVDAGLREAVPSGLNALGPPTGKPAAAAVA